MWRHWRDGGVKVPNLDARQASDAARGWGQVEKCQVFAERGSSRPEGVFFGPAGVCEAPQHGVQERAGDVMRLVVWGAMVEICNLRDIHEHKGLKTKENSPDLQINCLRYKAKVP